jgi:hypothetical protein
MSLIFSTNPLIKTGWIARWAIIFIINKYNNIIFYKFINSSCATSILNTYLRVPYTTTGNIRTNGGEKKGGVRKGGVANIKKVLIVGNLRVSLKNNIVNLVEKRKILLKEKNKLISFSII